LGTTNSPLPRISSVRCPKQRTQTHSNAPGINAVKKIIGIANKDVAVTSALQTQQLIVRLLPRTTRTKVKAGVGFQRIQLRRKQAQDHPLRHAIPKRRRQRLALATAVH
jgi:hypothetical protein